jgi:hypothetical protein
MPGIRREGVDGTAYAAGWHAFLLKADFDENPYQIEGNKNGWAAGWLDARDAFAERQAKG